MGVSALKRLADASRTVETEVDGETVVWRVPLDEEGAELLGDVIDLENMPEGISDAERRKIRVQKGTAVIHKWAPRLIEGADELSADDMGYVVNRIGYLRGIRAVQDCAGVRARIDHFSPRSS